MLLVILGGVAVIAVLAATVRYWADGDAATTQSEVRAEAHEGERSEPASLPQGNLRILTGAQTRRLVRYAALLRACLARREVEMDGPTKHSRTITLVAATRAGIRHLAALTVSCAATLGDPPSPASLQAVDERTVALSVPRQCLLDPKVEARPGVQRAPRRPVLPRCGARPGMRA